MPYSLFLVEDEVVTREGIRSSVDWVGAGYRWSGEAPDGELALSAIEESPPDILITDIRMPFMDGLELSRVVRARFPETRIVILSGHDEFRYAQEAIQLGVNEYLLKPIGVQELLETLARVSAEIEEERQIRERVSRLESRLDDNLNVMRQRLLVDLVTGRISSSVALDEATRIHVDLVARHYVTLIVRCQVVAGVSHLARLEAYHSVRQRVADLLSTFEDILWFVKDVEEIGIIIKGENAVEVQANASRLVEQIREALHGENAAKIGIGIGGYVPRLSELPESFLEAFDAAKAQTGEPAPGLLPFILPPQDLLALDPTAVSRYLRTGELNGLDAFLDSHLAPFRDGTDERGSMLEFLLGEMAVAVARFVQELGGDIDDALPEGAEFDVLLPTDGSVGQIRALMRRLLVQAITYRNQHTNRTQQLIAQAKDYIDLHLTDEEISLHTVADEVGWSPSHLSAVFSRATNETFIEYLTRQRIQKARELLRTTVLPVAEIGRRVGYANPRYFHVVFRKATGQTPAAFRHPDAHMGDATETDF